MTEQQAMRMALEAMEYADACLKKQLTTKTKHEYAQDLLLEAGTALRQALEQQPSVVSIDTLQERVAKTSESVQEPVAWISATELLVMRGNAHGGAKDWRVNLGLEPEEGDVGLYTTPPQRTWVWITDDEIEKMGLSNYIKVVRETEAKLKEKNT